MAPEIFQMRILEVIHGLQGIEIMADNILIYDQGDTIDLAIKDHNRNLENLLRLRENNCKLNRSKLNHILSTEGLKPDTAKVAAVQNMPNPKDRKDVERFVGLVNYLGRYLPNLSTELHRLRELTLQRTPWIWTRVE